MSNFEFLVEAARREIEIRTVMILSFRQDLP
jgi:hypothetical protein